jgi:hypothetical protein
MKRNIRKQIALGLSVLGLATALAVAVPSQAAPNTAVKREQRDVKAAFKDVKRERKELHRARTAAERRREQAQLRAAERNLELQRQQLNRARSHRRATSVRNRRPVYTRPRPASNNNARINNAANVNFTGTVLENTSPSRGFNVRADNGGVFAVMYRYASLRRGQHIRVIGHRENGLIIATDIDYL